MKNKGLANVLMVMVFAIVALSMGGCDNDDITGGGWILNNNGKKATFAFQFKCDGDDSGGAKVSGQFQYNDHNGVKFHAVADSLDGGTCDGLLNAYEGTYSGSYTPQPRKGRDGKLREGGRFLLTVRDNGKEGPSNGDTFELTLVGGVYNPHSVSATLAGGNIQAHGAKDTE